MLISTQTDRLQNYYGTVESIRMLKEAGFDAYDMSMYSMFGDHPSPLNGENWREEAQKIRAYADSIGMPCNQSHALFPPVKGDDSDSERFDTLLRHIEISSILGAKVVVVHPAQYLYYLKNADTLKEINMEFYRGLIPYCEKFKIKIAVENMWQYYNKKHGNRIAESVCARAEEFCEYIDTLNSPWIVACLDIGHVSLVGEDMTRMIHALGPRLQALHVHDTDTCSDLHTLPFHGKIDFEEVTQALADIDYQGDITLEADCFYGKIPKAQKEAHQAAAHYMAQISTTLRNMIQAKKQL